MQLTTFAPPLSLPSYMLCLTEEARLLMLPLSRESFILSLAEELERANMNILALLHFFERIQNEYRKMSLFLCFFSEIEIPLGIS